MEGPQVTMSRRLGLIGWIGLVFLVSSGVWWLGHSWFVSRDLTLSMQSADAPRRWAVLWEGRRGESPNGAWIDARTMIAPETLELILPGTRADGSHFRLWLDQVKGTTPGSKIIDLRPALTDSSTQGRWQEFGTGGGLAFAGPQSGTLVLTVPGGGVELAFAQTRSGGGFIAKYAGTVSRLDCYSDTKDVRTKVAIEPSRTALAVDGVATLRLPSYDIASLKLAWFGEGGKQATIGEPRVRTHLLWFTIREEALTIPVGTASRSAGDGVKYDLALKGGGAGAMPLVAGAKEPAGFIEFAPPRSLGVAWHLIGVAGVFAIAMAVVAVGVVVVTVLSFGRPRWLGVGFVVLVAAIAARLWVGSWATVYFCNDSVDYAATGINWVSGGSLESLKPSRMPGYAVFIGWLWQLPWGLNTVLAWVQGTMGVLTALLAWSITWKLVGRAWAPLAFLLVAMDPILIAWERFAMTETMTAFLVTLVVWIVVTRRSAGAAKAMRSAEVVSSEAARARVGGRWPRSVSAWMGISILSAVLVVAGVYVRPNLQVLVPLVPLLVVIEAWPHVGWRQALVLGAVCLGTGVGLLVPRIYENKRDYGVASVMVASSRNQFILGEPNGVMDMNHARAFTFDEWRSATNRKEAKEIGEWELWPMIGRSRAPVPPGRRGSAEREDFGPGIEDAKGGFVVRESYARLAPERLEVALASIGNLIGLYTWGTEIGFRENEYWTRPMRGIKAFRGSNFTKDQAQTMAFGSGGEALYRTCHRDVTEAIKLPQAAVFGEWFMAGRAIRPVLAVFLLLGVLAAVIRREWCMAWIGGVVLVHAAALAVLAMAGIDRYAVPFDPMLRIAAVYGLSVVVGWWGHGMRRSMVDVLGPTVG